MPNWANNSNCRGPVESNQVFWPLGEVIYSGMGWCWQGKECFSVRMAIWPEGRAEIGMASWGSNLAQQGEPEELWVH